MHGSNFVVKLSSGLAGNGLFPKGDRVEYTRIKHSSYFLISLYLYDIRAIVVTHDRILHGLAFPTAR